MRPLELTPSGILGSVAILVVVAACVRLGLWQLDRRDQRLARNAAVAERLAEPEATLTVPPRDTTGLTHRRVTLRGRYDTPRTIVLGGRSRGGAPGVHILSPLRLGEAAVLVNRGWLPSRDAATVDLEAVAVDTTVTITGVLLPLPATGAVEPGKGFRQTWFRLDAAAVRAQYPYFVSPLYVRAGGPAGERTAGDVGPIPLGPPELDAGPHLSYALQWFGFAVVFLVGWAALVAREVRAPRRDAGTTPAA